jgi:hypothetical protein
MKYLCLIYDDEKQMEGMPTDESDAFMGEYFGLHPLKRTRSLGCLRKSSQLLELRRGAVAEA